MKLLNVSLNARNIWVLTRVVMIFFFAMRIVRFSKEDEFQAISLISSTTNSTSKNISRTFRCESVTKTKIYVNVYYHNFNHKQSDCRSSSHLRSMSLNQDHFSWLHSTLCCRRWHKYHSMSLIWSICWCAIWNSSNWSCENKTHQSWYDCSQELERILCSQYKRRYRDIAHDVDSWERQIVDRISKNAFSSHLHDDDTQEKVS